jgi:hypothetical protein
VVGNPHRLRQLFRKFDLDRNGGVSTSEFLSALLANQVPLSKDEARLLAQVADTEDRGVVLYEDFVAAVAQVSGQPNSRPPASDRRPSSASAHAEVHPNQSTDLARSRPASRMDGMQRERSRSTVSVRSERSTASSRGTLGGSLRSERSDWMMDGTLRDSERKETRR